MDLSSREGRKEQGRRLQKAVERAGLSIEELANKIGCSRALLYQYLSGSTLAQPDRLQRIAQETGVSLAYFFGAEEEEARKGRKPADNVPPQTRFTERLQQMEELARAQEAPPDWNGLASTCERIISLAVQFEDDGAEAKALLQLGQARCRLGEFHRALESLERAATLFFTLNDSVREASARQAWGHALLALGKTTEAREQFAWVAEKGPLEARWSGTVSLAGVFEQIGDFRQAMEKCDEAAALLERKTDPRDIGLGMLYVNGNRVNLYLDCGDFAAAQTLSSQCMDEAEALGNSDQHLEARLNLGVCAMYQGRWAEAKKLLASSLQLARFLGDKSRESVARATLAILLAALCDCDACIEQAKDALAAALSQGDHRAELFAQMALADAYFSLGRDSEARYHANQALGVATALRLSLYQAACRLRIARLSIHLGDMTDARESLDKALTAAVRLGSKHLEAEARTLLAEWLRTVSGPASARSDAERALQLAREWGLKPLEWETLDLNARIALEATPPQLEVADGLLEQAIQLLENVRASLREAGIPDTMLEDRDRQALYLRRASLLTQLSKLSEARHADDSNRKSVQPAKTEDSDPALAFLEQVGWPPLLERYRHESRSKKAASTAASAVETTL